MEIGKAFTYVFEDEKWINKVLIGGLFALASYVLVGIPFLLGYFLQTMRNVMNRVERPLPEWDDLGGKFKEGLIMALIYIVWLIPIWVLLCLTSLVTAIAGNSYEAAGFVTAVSLIVNCLSVLYGIFLAIVAPAILIRYALNPQFRTGFEFAEIFDFVKRNIGNIIIAVLLGWVASLVASLGMILCVIGVLFTYFWAMMVSANLYGQVYLNRRNGTPIGPAEPTEPTPVSY